MARFSFGASHIDSCLHVYWAVLVYESYFFRRSMEITCKLKEKLIARGKEKNIQTSFSV